jgi:thioesterase domain-containing protein
VAELTTVGADVEAPPAVPIRTTGHRPPLFCLPPVSGSAYWSVPLAQHLPADQPIYAVECPGLEGGPLVHGLPAMAAVFVRSLRAVRPVGPYLLTGYSMGGLVAFEMARRLVAEGESVHTVVLVDSPPPRPREPSGETETLRQFLIDVAGALSTPLPPAALAGVDDVIAVTDPDERAEALHRLVCGTGLVPSSVDAPFLGRRYRMFIANMHALQRYDPGPYDGRVALLRATEAPERTSGWDRVARGPLTEIPVPGDHYTIWSADNRGAVIQAMGRCLSTALDHAYGQ